MECDNAAARACEDILLTDYDALLRGGGGATIAKAVQRHVGAAGGDVGMREDPRPTVWSVCAERQGVGHEALGGERVQHAQLI